MADIDEIISDFTSKLKPVTPEMVETGIVPEEAPPVPPEEVVEAPPAPGEACVTKEFKTMLGALDPGFVGKDGADIKELVVSFVESLPQCE